MEEGVGMGREEGMGEYGGASLVKKLINDEVWYDVGFYVLTDLFAVLSNSVKMSFRRMKEKGD